MNDQQPGTAETTHSASDDPDVRMEYAGILENLRLGVTTLWDAFKTYFTVIGLLFAGSGVMLAKDSPFERTLSIWASLVIAFAGLAITLLAGLGVNRIVAYQRQFIERGIVLEVQVRSKLLQTSGHVWDKAPRTGATQLTYIVFGIFALAWVALGAYCYHQLP
jgi:hypothetical protein